MLTKPDDPAQFMSFASRRSTVHGLNGMVSCTQPLAAAAGQKILLAGGNAAVSLLKSKRSITEIQKLKLDDRMQPLLLVCAGLLLSRFKGPSELINQRRQRLP
jgi:hypothetical protein